MFRSSCLYVVLMVCAFTTGARASTITVGSGSNQAILLVDFSDGADYTFDVHFDGTTTGIGLFDVIEAGTTLTTNRQTFGSDVYIDGISFQGHSDSGYGGGDNWWHYWNKDIGQSDWAFASVGPSSRTVEDGFWDGWVYGNENAPVPEPSAIVILASGALLFIRRRWNHTA